MSEHRTPHAAAGSNQRSLARDDAVLTRNLAVLARDDAATGLLSAPQSAHASASSDSRAHHATATLARIPELDGLRGIAIGLVLVCHCLVASSVSPPGSIQGYAAVLLNYTWSGVDLFFVLSGFLIGGILLDVRASDRYYRTFYARRAYRILPLYAVVVVILLFLAHLFANRVLPVNPASTWFAEDTPPLLSLATFTQNFWMTRLGAFGAFAIAPTWSLAVEEQFYLTLPWVVRHLTRRRLTIVCIAVLAIAPVIRTLIFVFLKNGWVGAYVLMPARADALVAGVLVAILTRSPECWQRARQATHIVKALAFAAAVFLLYATVRRMTTRSPVIGIAGYSAFALVYATLLGAALACPADGWLRRVLRYRWLRSLGGIAYGTYLFHMPVFALAFWALGGIQPTVSTAREVAIALLSIAMSVSLAKLSWWAFEARMVRRGQVYRY